MLRNRSVLVNQDVQATSLQKSSNLTPPELMRNPDENYREKRYPPREKKFGKIPHPGGTTLCDKNTKGR